MLRTNLSSLTEHQKHYRRKLQQKLRRKKNPEKEAEYNKRASSRKRKWQVDNAEKISARHKKRYEECREEVINRVKKYSKDNKEKIKASRKERYERDKDKILQKNKEWRDNQPRERLNQYLRDWKANNRARVAESNHKRNHIQRNCINFLSKNQVDIMNQFYKASKRIGDCLGVAHQVDHIMPLCGNGFSGLHVPWNLQILPSRINARKGNRING
ncbi:MAG: hypothetical protein ACPGII_09300 [Opitutales bacterium]